MARKNSSTLYRKNIQADKMLVNLIKEIEGGVRSIKSAGAPDSALRFVANSVLKDVTYRHGRYNNWSGNLNRSYFVYAVSQRHGEGLYGVSDNERTIGTPDLVTGYEIGISDERVSAKLTSEYTHRQYDVKGITRAKNKRANSYFYKLSLRRHRIRGRWNKKHNGTYYREVRRSSKTYRERPFEYPHPYTDEIPRVRHMLVPKRKYASIVVGNYAPYRRFVEAKGYRVLHGNDVGKWKKTMEKVCHESVSVSIKQLAYQFRKGQKIHIGHSGDKWYEHNAGYVTPRKNAKYSYRNKRF